MYQRFLKITKRIWGAIFLGFALVFMIRYFSQETKHLGQPIHFAPEFIGLAALFQTTFWLLASNNWKQIIYLTTGTSLPLIDSFGQLAAVSIGKYLPGKVWGMIARAAHMKSRGANFGDIFVATYYEQYFLLGSAAALSAIFSAFLFYERKLAWIITILLVVSILISKPIQRIGIRISFYLWRKVGRDVPTRYALSMPTGNYIKLFLEFLLLWILNGCVFAALYFGLFSEPYSTHTLFMLILANTVGITVGFLALFAPGGIGIREAVASAILSHSMPIADAVFLSLIYRLWVVTMEMLSGLAFLSSTFRHKRPH